MPKVSIITPCYNAERYLERTIRSVQAQTFANWEHVIVDDGSTDQSERVAEDCARGDSRIRLVRQENRGVNSARNAGYAASSPESEYLLFLDADDILRETMLETMATYLDHHADVCLAHCDYTRIDHEGCEIPGRDRPPRLRFDGRRLVPLVGDPETPFDTMLWWLYLPTMSALIRRSVYSRLPGWDENFSQGYEDTDFFLHFALAGPVHFVPQVLVEYRIHGNQATKKVWFMKKQRGVLHAKWLQGAKLSEAQHSAFTAQWRLYESRLLPGYFMREAWSGLARGGFLRAAKLTLRAAAHLAIYCTAPCRRLAWPYLWYLS